ncbi:uncharacterized protein LOC134711176 isoform X2 [Mytilus trossulus]|uniref:uncharacterized protein LOC134711176 isoform X2 n=1 Tax=Mytilus trossulus TaxID=6551 RepID=UPI003003BE47
MLKIVLLFALLYVYVDCFVKVENYQNSVYIQRGYTRGYIFEKAPDTTVFEPRGYDLMSDESLSDVGRVFKKGHLVQFYKYKAEFLSQHPVLRFYFTNDEYYQNISKTIIEEMTANPDLCVKQ